MTESKTFSFGNEAAYAARDTGDAARRIPSLDSEESYKVTVNIDGRTDPPVRQVVLARTVENVRRCIRGPTNTKTFGRTEDSLVIETEWRMLIDDFAF